MGYDLHSKFNIAEHKKHYIHYLEVTILPDGVIEYAIPSHQEHLIALACDKLGVDRDTLFKMTPPEYYFDFLTWLQMQTGAISVWEDGVYFYSVTPAQRRSLCMLKVAGLYRGAIPDRCDGT